MINDVAITGIGIHPFGRFDGVSVTDMGVAAVRGALADAGNPRFEAAFCATVYSGVAAGHKVLGALGLTGVPIVNVEAGCASGGAALMLAANAVANGQYETVLVFGMEKMPKGMIRSSFFEPWREQGGLAVTPAYFALRAQRVMRESGVTKEHLARVVVKNRANGANNPNAMYQSATTAEDVLASRVVCAPLPRHMLCSPNDGAAAVIVQRAREGSADVRFAGGALRSHLPGSVLGEATPMSGIDDVDIKPPSMLAAEAAYEEAGLGPDDLDVVECQDTDAARELLGYEELHLCERGGSGALLESGATEPGGKLPVNPSGGLLAKGEPLGASSLGQVVELTQQLRGTAGARQVDGARVALAHTVGRGANAAVVILTK